MTRAEEFHKISFEDIYEITTQIDNQYIRLVFHEEDLKYYVSLTITNKRRNINSSVIDLKSTGKIGLDGLVWAKSKILPFVEYIKELKKLKEVVIIVRWEDNKRRRAYERGLRSLGFYYKMIHNKKCLCKRFI